MIKKFGIVAALCFLLMIIGLSGCQKIISQIPFLNRTPGSEPTVSPTIEPSSEPMLPQIPSAVPDLTNKLTIWLPPQFDPDNGTPAGELLKAQLEKFVEENPGTAVNVRIKAATGSGGLLDSLSTASAAAPAVLPGIILLSRSDLETAASNGLLLPIEPRDLVLDEADLFNYAWDMAQTKSARYGIPFAGDVLVMAYKPLQIGYPPKLWQDIIQQQSILAFPAADPKGLIPITLYLEAGGNFGGNEPDVTLQEVPLQRSLQLIADCATGNIFPYWLTEFTTFDQSWQSLQDSSASYAIIWASQYLNNPPDNITITSLPSSNNEPSITLADGWVLAFPQTSPERYQSHLSLAKYLIEPEFQKTWSESAGVLPVTKSALSGWTDSNLAGTMLPSAESARLLPSTDTIHITGGLFSSAAQELIRKQVSYIQASNAILKELSE